MMGRGLGSDQLTPEAMNKPIGLVLITSTGTGVKLVADLQGLPPRALTVSGSSATVGSSSRCARA